MNPYKRILLTIIGSVCISFILMWIVQSQPINDNDLEATANLNGSQLSELNLVDHMVNLPLELQIAKVSYQHSILSVDLLSVPGNTIDTMVYHDLFELSQFGLFHVSNVNQVLVRIIEHKETVVNRNELLLAMDSRKENVQNQGLAKKDLNTVNRLKYLQSHYNLTYTQKWKEQFVD
ncbi:hypothetical protein EHS13_19305 [Paenibacillus psychroresistens]|uniref:DUF4825 domain-containing protein n=1 Tax=Paenibacillus psychroresistens TaxID=1778678 RepID=A0A6B8RM09_9BACL|nr:hypothetical protein [Paenibacillus psychroresistens]QGQ96877.1 hypothetical protein EHS13_19305 [Paenibacillus psychroresistens]